MAITKFMQAMFSANEREDEELAGQVAEDIESAKENGEVDTEEVNYKHLGDGNVMIHDKVNDEVTLAKKAQDEHETYDLVAVPTEDLDMYLHMAEDGVTPDESVEGVDEEHYEEHMEEPMDYMEDEYVDGSELNDEEREFSVYSDNKAVQRIFSDQEFMERIFNEVIESEETAKVGDIKIEKIDDDTVLVTSEATGDQARVELDGSEMEVTELDQKEMSEDYEDEECYNGCGSSEQYEPMFVVGVDAGNHVIVDAPVYNEEDAMDLAQRLEESGVEGIGIFENPDEAREHAEELLNSLGIDSEEQVGEPEQAEFSDYGVYVTRYFSYDELEEIENEYYERLFSEVDPEECTEFMLKMFSETEDDAPTQEKIEDALESGEEIEEDGEVITPISDDTVVVEDKNNGEFTKVTLDGDEMDVEKISREEAEELVEDIAVESEEDEDEEDEEREFSDLYVDVDPFELSSDEVTSYMMRLFSESEDDEETMQEDVESALEDGEQVETSDEIITPISDDTVVVEDKESGEYTKVTVEGEEMHVEKLSESEAEDLLEDVEVEETEEEQEEREFSENNSMILKFFNAPMAAAPVQAPVQQQVPMEQAPVEPMPMDMPVEVPSVEEIEDKALAAVEAIHAAAQDAANMIQQAKDAPVPGAEEDLQEAQFSYYWDEEDAEERFYSETETLGSWLTNNIR